MQIQGKTALVTGAGSGLGEAAARRLAAAGAHVVIADLERSDGASVAASLPSARFVPTDVTDAEQVQAAIAVAVELGGGLHVAVNCAGVAVAMRTVTKAGAHDYDSFKFVVGVNLFGTFNVLRLAAARMATQDPDAGGERGLIVNTASIAAFDGQIGQIAYASSKAAVAGMTLPAARDLASMGIRVMTIAPGLFDTRMLAALPAEARTQLGTQVPFPSRLGDPAEYAELVAAIVANPMLNGETIRLDGALRMPPR